MSQIQKEYWGEIKSEPVYLFTLKNSSGAYVEIISYGAVIKSIFVPDREGGFSNVVAGFPTLEDYLQDTCYTGATIGRFANRIGNGSFMMDGKLFKLNQNEGENMNHGGEVGFNSKVFSDEIRGGRLTLSTISKDGDNGFPADICLDVTYWWTDEDELRITYHATSTSKSPLNITNHAYFNLSGFQEDVMNHRLEIAADRVVETDIECVPTGRILPAGQLYFDGKKIREKVHLHGTVPKGVNTYYIIDKDIEADAPVCQLKHNSTGRKLSIYTTYPGLQLYTGDFFGSKFLGNHKKYYRNFDALCLECHYYPDFVNHKQFPQKFVSSAEPYKETIRLKFSTFN